MYGFFMLHCLYLIFELEIILLSLCIIVVIIPIYYLIYITKYIFKFAILSFNNDRKAAPGKGSV